MMKAYYPAIVAVMLASGAPMPLLAQSNAPQPSAEQAPPPPANDGDIVVTARRREETLSKVPISITALSAAGLAARSIQSETDLQSAVPGLTIRQNGNANAFNYVIRGQTIDTYSNSPPGVLPYIDEAQVVSHSGTAFYDLANIQVLKGPQGTLFGRNATGGAVLYGTAMPTDEAGGYVSARYGNFDAHHEEGAVNLPLSQAIRLRIAGSNTGGGAFVRNLNDGKLLGNLEQRSIRGTLWIAPTPGLTNSTVVQYTHDGGTNTPGLAYHSSAYACGNGHYTDTADCTYGPTNPAFVAYLAAHPNLFQGGVTAYANLQDKRGPWVTTTDVPLYHRATSTFVINTTALALSSQVKIKNIAMFNDSKSDDAFNYDGTPYPIFSTIGTPTADATSQTNQQGFILQTKQFSDELQVQGTAIADRLNYVVGLYYLNQRDVVNSSLFAFDFSPLAAGSSFFYKLRTTDKSYAAFAQGTYKVTDALNFTAGIRYTREEGGARQLPGSLWTFFLPANNMFYPQKKTDSKPSWNVSLDYALTSDVIVYATTRGSWRGGGFNYTLLPNNSSTQVGGNIFEPETTRDVEVGAKYSGRGLGVPASLNIAFYNQWVSNIQRAANVVGFGATPTLLTVNVPKAQITGFEVDGQIRPSSWLSVGGSVSYTNARFTDGRVKIAADMFSYGPYADTPKWTGSAFAEVSHQLGSKIGTLTLRGDLFAETKMYFSNLADTRAPGTDIAGYALVNGRLTWAEVMGTPLTASFFARNITDKKYYGGGNPTGPNLGVNVANPGQPRMYGVEVRVKF